MMNIVRSVEDDAVGSFVFSVLISMAFVRRADKRKDVSRKQKENTTEKSICERSTIFFYTRMPFNKIFRPHRG